jgi:hypothetical protein
MPATIAGVVLVAFAALFIDKINKKEKSLFPVLMNER